MNDIFSAYSTRKIFSGSFLFLFVIPAIFLFSSFNLLCQFLFHMIKIPFINLWCHHIWLKPNSLHGQFFKYHCTCSICLYHCIRTSSSRCTISKLAAATFISSREASLEKSISVTVVKCTMLSFLIWMSAIQTRKTKKDHQN